MKKTKLKIKLLIKILLMLLISAGALVYLLCDIRQTLYFSSYSENDGSYMDDFYKDKTVLFFVPHEDDEYNLGGGILEQYADMDSEVYVVYMTNGDAYGGGERRINESIAAMTRIGIPENNLIFLGYGDTMTCGSDDDMEHIYNIEGNLEVVAPSGYDHTYATDAHPDFHTSKYGESAKYTRNNMKSDIWDVLNDIKPQIIYSIDCDTHPDHRTASLLFEEVMGEYLKENKDYKPQMFKGFGYPTGWEGVPDYYADNVMSTKCPYESGLIEERIQCSFWDRVRLPVSTKNLAPTRSASFAYETLNCYSSQDAVGRFDRLINSDKVFWERRTDSKILNANISASSGETSVLNDFKLSDSNNVSKREKAPKWKAGLWKADEEDADKKITVKFNDKEIISRITLYDSSCKDSDILDCEIIFDDGTRIKTGPLLANGSPTNVDFEPKEVESFEIKVLDYTGKDWGLYEIEAYENIDRPVEFIKLMVDDEFAYDYFLKKGQNINISAYAFPEATKSIDIYLDGKLLENNCFVYDGRSHEVVACLSENKDIYDRIKLMPLGLYDRVKIKLARVIESR